MLPNIDPKVGFYLGLAVVIAQALAVGGPTLFDPSWMPVAAAAVIIGVSKSIVTVGTPVMTYIAGSNMTQSGRLANVQTVPAKVRAEDLANDNDIAHVVLKDQRAADAIPGNKVIGPADIKTAA